MLTEFFIKMNLTLLPLKILYQSVWTIMILKFFVAENSDRMLVGFVQLYPLFSSTRMKKLWLLNDLFVNPEFRSKGVSVNLIDKSKQLVKETKACGMFLETEKSNFIGNNLYPKTEFKLNEGSNYYEWNNN